MSQLEKSRGSPTANVAGMVVSYSCLWIFYGRSSEAVCFMLPALLQITTELDGCKALLYSGGHKQVTVILVISFFLMCSRTFFKNLIFRGAGHIAGLITCG